MKEIKSLTGLRGIAAIYVLIFHWYGWMCSKTDEAFATKNSFSKPIHTFLNHGYISVDVFFILSGFVLCLSSSHLFQSRLKFRDYLNFMKKRFARLFPLYFFLTTLFFILFHKFSELKIYLANLTLLQSLLILKKYSIVEQAWSLSTEWLLYFLFPLLIFSIFFIYKKTSNIIFILYIISIAILFIIMSQFHLILNGENYAKFISEGSQKWGFIVNRTSGLSAILRCFTGYLFGITSYIIFKNKVLVFSSFKIITITIVLILLLFIEKSDLFFLLLVPVFLYYLTQNSVINNFLSSKVVYFLGEISYSLYMVHLIIIWKLMPAINVLLFKYFNFTHSYIVDFFTTLFLSIIISTITYYIIEKSLNNKLRTLLISKSS